MSSGPVDRPFVLLGAGGHARVLLALLRAAGHAVLGVCDPRLAAEGAACWEGLDVLGDDAAIHGLGTARVRLALGIGQLSTGTLRARMFEQWKAAGYEFPSLVHPAAWLADDARLAEGVQIMAGSIVQPGCSVGENSVVNTRASIDHDCRIAGNVHVAPGATLCGSVCVGAGAFIGAGAVVIQGLSIGERAVVGAGVTLVRDLAEGQTVIGAANRMQEARQPQKTAKTDTEVRK